MKQQVTLGEMNMDPENKSLLVETKIFHALSASLWSRIGLQGPIIVPPMNNPF